MQLAFEGPMIHWRGPSPWFFVVVPPAECVDLRETASMTSYGWGVIPVTARVGDTTWTTSLFPRDGGYLVPVKAAVRRAEHLDEGDTVGVSLTVAL